LAQQAKQVFWRYPTHVISLVEEIRRCWVIALVLASVAFYENASHNEQENGAKSAGESYQYDETDCHFSSYEDISSHSYSKKKLDHIPKDVNLSLCSEKS